MITVTSEYLINVIERHLRGSGTGNFPRPLSTVEPHPVPSSIIADFLLSIPYFDADLKNFILGKAKESVMIVSQAWEIEFIIRTKSWATSETWKCKTFSFNEAYIASAQENLYSFLKLPY